MPPIAGRPKTITPVGVLIWDAMERRSRPGRDAAGQPITVPYTYVELARDLKDKTGRETSAGYLRNIVTGYRKQPTREVLLDIATVLGLDPDETLVLAGQVPVHMQQAALRQLEDRIKNRAGT